MTKQVRYAINVDNQDKVLVYGLDEGMKSVKDIPGNNRMSIYVDILSVHEFSYKVKMYFVNGNTIVGYIAYKPYNPIKITNMEELFDGRFNS